MSMGFPRQEYWSGQPFRSLGDLVDQGIEPWSPAFQARSLLSEPPWKLCKKLEIRKCDTFNLVLLFQECFAIQALQVYCFDTVIKRKKMCKTFVRVHQFFLRIFLNFLILKSV